MTPQFARFKYIPLALLFSLSIALPASADVCFLPDGQCMSGLKLGSQSPSSDDNCAGYGAKKSGQGWDCSDTCTAHGHIYYNCIEKQCSPGYNPGVSSCERGYIHQTDNSYSGDLLCGRCVEDKCPQNTHLSRECETPGYLPVETQYYVGENRCFMCVNDNCDTGLKKKCDNETELALRVERTQYGSLCYKCCNNVCNSGSLNKPTCDNGKTPQEVSRTNCSKPCYECR
jgi:hypothetical protein